MSSYLASANKAERGRVSRDLSRESPKLASQSLTTDSRLAAPIVSSRSSNWKRDDGILTPYCLERVAIEKFQVIF
jgi:hypothetical protein